MNLAAIHTETLPFDSMTKLALAILLLPLFTFFFLIFFGRRINKYRGITATVLMLINLVMAIVVTCNTWAANEFHARWEWFNLGKDISFTLGIQLDNLSAFMLIVVTGVSFLVHLFSIEYIRGDRHFEKYFAYLGLFTFSMLGIVLSDNLFAMFVFWELVGLSSYLLIGFYFQKEEAIYANKKAFITNRIGDAGFIIGLMVLWSQFGTLDLETLKSQLPTFSGEVWLLSLAGFGILCGAIGKSAQFPLQVWLPNAMEGPTPVSALIHAATMVAAGIYLLARTYFILQPDVLTTIAFVGGITAFIGAVTALAQTDIKRVLAFSTISQLGYMMMGMGVGAYDAALFHLLTHAFFKACLFLSAGAVIYNMHQLEHQLEHEGKDVHFDAQDMRVMGGLRKKMPATFYPYLIATLALAGLPLTSGFLSKDAILNGALSWAQMKGGISYLIPTLGFVSALLTAFYMGRQLFMVFFGEFKLEKLGQHYQGAYDKVKETPVLMLLPIVLLGALSLGIFYSINPVDGSQSWFTAAIAIPQSPAFLEQMHHNHVVVSVGSMVIAFTGLFLAYLMYYKKSLVISDENAFKKVLKGLSLNHWYLDAIYHATIVRATLTKATLAHQFDVLVVDRIVNSVGVIQLILANLVGSFDKYIVDGVVNLSATITGVFGKILRSQFSGKVQNYIAISIVMVILLVFLIVKSS